MTIIIAGLDVGNGYVKFSSDAVNTRFPSYLEYYPHRPSETPREGYVEYLEGSAQELPYQAWASGWLAYARNPMGTLRVSDDAQAKAKQSLQHLLGALSHIEKQHTEMEVFLCVSLHQKEGLEEMLIKSLEGTHIVKFGGKVIPTKVTVKVLKVYEEGHAAIAANMDKLKLSGTNIIIDLGNRTNIATLIGERGIMVERKAFGFGVEDLIKMISQNPKFLKKLEGETAILHEVRLGLENANFQYGKLFKFDDIYSAELKNWVVKAMSPVFKFIQPWKISAESCLVIGGGSLLPKVREAFESKGFVVADDPVWSNVVGLQKAAQHLHKKVGE
jgi:Actin like proteins N terminal domain